MPTGLLGEGFQRVLGNALLFTREQSKTKRPRKPPIPFWPAGKNHKVYTIDVELGAKHSGKTHLAGGFGEPNDPVEPAAVGER